MGPAAIGAALNNIPTLWAVPIAATIGFLTYELSTFCTQDPPDIPSVDWTDQAIALLDGPQSSGYIAAVNAFRDLIGHYLWYDFCECTAGGTPTGPGSPPSAPTDFPILNPPQVGTPVPVTPCMSLDSGVQTVTQPASTNAINQVIVPDGAVSFNVTAKFLSATGGLTHMAFQTLSNTTTGFTGATSRDVSPTTQAVGSTYTKSIAIPAGARYWTVNAIPQNGSVGDHGTVEVLVDVFCGAPGSPSVPCCPPDPSLELALRNIWQTVQLIQRQAVPFGYIASTSHSGLSGAGSLSISGLLGAKVDVTTLPSSYGRSGTSPTEYFDLGFVSFGTADGFPTSYRVEHDPTLMLPARCSAYTELDYDLAPGVVVTITELVREP